MADFRTPAGLTWHATNDGPSISVKELTERRFGADCPTCGKPLTSYDAERKTWWCGAELREVKEWRPDVGEAVANVKSLQKLEVEKPSSVGITYVYDFDPPHTEKFVSPLAEAIERVRRALETRADPDFLNAMRPIYETLQSRFSESSPYANRPASETLTDLERLKKLGMSTLATEPPICCVAPTPAILSDMFAMLERHDYRVEAVLMSRSVLARFREQVCISNVFDATSSSASIETGLAGWLFGAMVISGPNFPPEVRVVSEWGPKGERSMPRAAYAHCVV
jgi:hypothetical protein